jgi:hypothetical protein
MILGEIIETVDARRAPMIPVSGMLAALTDRPTGLPLIAQRRSERVP